MYIYRYHTYIYIYIYICIYILNIHMHYYNSHMSVALSAQFEVMVKELASKPKWGPKTAAMFLAGPPKSARGCISRPLGCISLTHINAHAAASASTSAVSAGTSAASACTCEQTADSKAHRAQGTSQQTAESEAAKPQAEGKGMSSNPVEPKDYSEDSKFVATTARTAARTASF